MRSPETFDAVYADTRHRLLLETYALTGDLPAARTAVRDAFVTAWHHWPKVAGLDGGPESWLRPQAHSRALHRHTARPWHRDKHVPDDVRETLDALSELTGQERKALVLASLSELPLEEIVREVGLPHADTARVLQGAVTRFAAERGIEVDEIGTHLAALAGPLADTHWPRSTALRRTGTARRRTHMLVGSAAVVAALLVSGTIVSSGGAEPSSLDTETALPGVSLRTAVPEDEPALAPEHLLAVEQVRRYGRGLDWAEGRTADNLAGSGLVMPCQQERFADPAGAGALMRSFTGTADVVEKKRAGTGRKARTTRTTVTEDRASAVEFVELSTDEKQAQATFEVSRGWYAGCLDARTQLLSTETVERVGDEATVLTLRTWARKPARITVALARTGRLTVTSLVRSTGAPVDARTAAAGLAAAVNAACGSPGAGTCAGPPKVSRSQPSPIGRPSGLLGTVDLPPVTGAVGPWVGTDPERARDNFTATRCGDTQFRGRGMKHTLTRTFLFPPTETESDDAFGLTQTVATMRPAQARSFVQGVRDRIQGCSEANLGTSVTTLAKRSDRTTELTAWDLEVEIADDRTIRFWMAIMRDGNAVSQVAFTPAGDMSMTREDFTAVAERALARLSDLPSARR